MADDLGKWQDEWRTAAEDVDGHELAAAADAAGPEAAAAAPGAAPLNACATYRNKVRPLLEAAARLLESPFIPNGKKYADAIRLVMGIADGVCPA